MKNILLALTFFLGLINQTYAQGSLSTGLVLYLPFNGNTLDMSPYGNHATNYGATLTTDAAGNPNSAYLFNGTSNYMRILNNASLQCDSQISLCAKVKPLGYYTGTCYGNSIIQKGSPDFISGNYGLRFSSPVGGCSSYDTTTQNYVGFFGGTHPSVALVNNTPRIVTNSWDCIVFTYNRDSVKMYVNGTLRFKFKSNVLIGKNLQDVFLARMNSTTFPYWLKGILDDVRIYNRALSAAEVNTYCGFSAPTNTITADFKDTSTSCLSKQFTDLSTVTSTGIKLWFWNFGDGGTSNLKNPIHTYSLPGTYSVKLIVVDSNGYSDTIAKSIYTAKYKFANAGNDTTVCDIVGGTVISLNAKGGLLYSWSPAIGLSNPSIANPIATITTPIAYEVTITDSFGCTDKDTIAITLDTGFAKAGNDTAVCMTNGIATTTLNASGGLSYSWSPSTGLSNPGIANPIATFTTTKTYVVAVTNGRGCTELDTITLITSKFAKANKDTTLCLVEGKATISLLASGGVAYHWSPSLGLSDSLAASPLATITNNTTYIVTVRDTNGCNDYDTVKLSIDPIKVIIASKNTSDCIGKKIGVSASGAASYEWLPASDFANNKIANPILTVSGSKVYVVIGTSLLGCIAKDTLTVSTIPSSFKVIATPDTASGCLGKEIQLTATGAKNYKWIPATGLDRDDIANPKLAIVQSFQYVVVGTDTSGCSDRDTVDITMIPTPNVKATSNGETAKCEKSTVMLSATGAEAYRWNPDIYCEKPNADQTIVFPTSNQVFTVIGTNAYGCIGQDTITVFHDGATLVRIPNTFSPNGDGLNDKIKPIIVCDFKLESYVIYNRWGEQVYITDKANAAWDGTSNGKPCGVGVYYYLIKGKNALGENVMLKGDVTLMR